MGLCSFIQNYKRWSPISKVQGLQCDNPSCDWSDMSISREEYPVWLNRSCPKCGAACTHNVSINPRTKIALRGKAAEAATLAFHSLKLHIDKMYVSTKGELAKRFKLEDLFEDTQDRKKATYPHK